jgi:hypothetical protein
MTEPKLRDDQFQEMTAHELAKLLLTYPEDCVVEIEVQNDQGRVIVSEGVRLHVGAGFDMDGQTPATATTYHWSKITVRMEPPPRPEFLAKGWPAP